ncbi:hypothetical protein ACFC4S_22625 [Priestia megaterium]|uniref:hypothetical protein n=1 Tax=Priestia megaterium TaxID=1404 RepID=UPI0035DA8399
MNTSSYLKVYAARYLKNEKESISLHTQKHFAELIKDTQQIKLIDEQIGFLKREWSYIQAAIVTEYRELNGNSMNIDNLYNNSTALSNYCNLILNEGNELFVCDKEGTLINTVSIEVVRSSQEDSIQTILFKTNKDLIYTETRKRSNQFYLKVDKSIEKSKEISIFFSDHFEATNIFKEPLKVAAECEKQLVCKKKK